jgi:hypothetical protein
LDPKGKLSEAGRFLQAQARSAVLLHFVKKDSQRKKISQVQKEFLFNRRGAEEILVSFSHISQLHSNFNVSIPLPKNFDFDSFVRRIKKPI